MKILKFTINEKPIPQKRHRHSPRGTYNPMSKEKLYYGLLVKNCLSPQFSPFMGPVEIELSFFMPLPRTKRLRNSKGLYHTNKPDLDNCIKFFLDVMSGIIYKDDAYIYKIIASKCYSGDPRIEVIANQVSQPDSSEREREEK